MMHMIAACQQMMKAIIIPKQIVTISSKIVTMTSDVIPFREAILEEIMDVMMPGARSSRSNQLIYLCIISSMSLILNSRVSFSPMIAKKIFSIEPKMNITRIVQKKPSRISLALESQSGSYPLS